MSTCEFCGKSFDEEYEAEKFDDECPYGPFNYNNFTKTLCADCAISVFEDKISDAYYEICERCGMSFDYIQDSSDFCCSETGYSELSDFDLIMCCDCAREEYEKGCEDDEDE